MICWYYILYICVTYVVVKYLIRKFFIIKSTASSKHIVITGCDSGFGRLMTLKFDVLHAHIYAGCYTDEGVESLRDCTSSNVHVYKVDIANDASVNEFLNSVKERTHRVDILINNAGILDGFRCEFTPLEIYQRILEVNTVGHIRVTKAFLPMFTENARESSSGGRIIFMNSASAEVPLAGFGAYATSKAAIRAFCFSLRRELRAFGIHVASIEPGGNKTPLTGGIGERVRSIANKAPQSVTDMFDPSYVDDFVKAMSDTSLLDSGSAVVDAALHAALSPWPFAQYCVGWDAFFLGMMKRIFGETWVLDVLVTYPPTKLRTR